MARDHPAVETDRTTTVETHVLNLSGVRWHRKLGSDYNRSSS
jgi:hypothetical protein